MSWELSWTGSGSFSCPRCWSAKTQPKVGKLPLFLFGQLLWEAKANWAWGFAGPCLPRACLGWELCVEHGILSDGKDPEDAQVQPSGSSTMNHVLHTTRVESSTERRRKRSPFPTVPQSSEELSRNSCTWSFQHFYQALRKSVKRFQNPVFLLKNPEEAARSPLLPHLPLRPRHIALTLDFGTATAKKRGGKSLTNIISSSNYIWWQ